MLSVLPSPTAPNSVMVTLCGRDPGGAWSRSSPRAVVAASTTTTNARTTCIAAAARVSRKSMYTTRTKHGALNWKRKSFESTNKAPETCARILAPRASKGHLRCHKISAGGRGGERSGEQRKGPPFSEQDPEFRHGSHGMAAGARQPQRNHDARA